MSADELETVIARLSDEATDLRDRAVETAWRVRALPYGQDRFHRLYWALPHNGVVVVESAESVQRNNAACDLADCADDSPGIDGKSLGFQFVSRLSNRMVDWLNERFVKLRVMPVRIKLNLPFMENYCEIAE